MSDDGANAAAIEHLAASKLQAAQRGQAVRQELQKQHSAATRLQAMHRGKKAREVYTQVVDFDSVHHESNETLGFDDAPLQLQIWLQRQAALPPRKLAHALGVLKEHEVGSVAGLRAHYESATMDSLGMAVTVLNMIKAGFRKPEVEPESKAARRLYVEQAATSPVVEPDTPTRVYTDLSESDAGEDKIDFQTEHERLCSWLEDKAGLPPRKLANTIHICKQSDVVNIAELRNHYDAGTLDSIGIGLSILKKIELAFKQDGDVDNHHDPVPQLSIKTSVSVLEMQNYELEKEEDSVANYSVIDDILGGSTWSGSMPGGSQDETEDIVTTPIAREDGVLDRRQKLRKQAAQGNFEKEVREVPDQAESTGCCAGLSRLFFKGGNGRREAPVGIGIDGDMKSSESPRVLQSESFGNPMMDESPRAVVGSGLTQGQSGGGTRHTASFADEPVVAEYTCTKSTVVRAGFEGDSVEVKPEPRVRDCDWCRVQCTKRALLPAGWYYYGEGRDEGV